MATNIRLSLPASAAARLAAIPREELSKAFGVEVLAVKLVADDNLEFLRAKFAAIHDQTNSTGEGQ